jgi:hypothetical protein
VGVHVPEAGKEGFAGRVDDFRKSAVVAPEVDVDYAIPFDQDGSVRDDFSGLGIENVGILKENATVGWVMSKFGGEIGGAGFFDLILGG